MVVTQKVEKTVRQKVVKLPFIAVPVLLRLLFCAFSTYCDTAQKDVAVFETLGRDIIDRSEAAASAAERLSFYIKTGCIAEKTEPIKLKTIL